VERPTPAAPVTLEEPKVAPPATFVRADRAEEPVVRKQFSDAGWPARDIVEQTPAASERPEPVRVMPSSREVDSQASSQQGAQPAPAAPSGRNTPASSQTFASNMDSSVASPRPSATPVAPPPTPTPPRKKRDTPTGKDAQISSGFSKPIRTPADARPEVNKTLKCPECGTPNYPTEWYCERCGGELATM
jgi:hypothetical protein